MSVALKDPSRSKAPSKRSSDRLFVPLSSDPFAWFRSGKKTWELRKRGRQYTCSNVWRGRDVELRRGYTNAESALWGEIIDVIEADSIEAFFKCVHWQTVLPESSSLDAAIADARRILNINDDEDTPVLGFKVELTHP